MGGLAEGDAPGKASFPFDQQRNRRQLLATRDGTAGSVLDSERRPGRSEPADRRVTDAERPRDLGQRSDRCGVSWQH
jgi:hypothetical protein